MLSQTYYVKHGILIFFLLYFLLFAFKWRRGKKYKYLHKSYTLKKLKKMDWEEFESLSAELFLSMGWKVQGNKIKGADGGIDIRATKRGKRAIVQCKKYNNAIVGVRVVREMFGLMHESEADVAYVVTSNRFTKECFRFAEGKNIKLIDGEQMLSLMR